MSVETENLEHKAEGHRARVDSSLDELRGRLSIGQIVDEVWGQLRHSQGGDVVKNVGRQVRDNPLALGLIGAGVAWLLSGEGVRAEGRDLKRRFEDWSDADDGGGRGHQGYRSARPESGDHVAGLRPRGTTATSNNNTSEPSLTDKAKSGASTLTASASDAAGRAGDAVSGAAESAADRARRAGESVSDAAASAGESARYYATEVGHYGRHGGRNLYARGQSLRRSFLDTLYEEPMIIGGVALAIGAAIGASLPSTRREDELLGPVRDDVRNAAYAYGEDVAERAGHVAEKAYEAASEEADRKGLKPQDDASGETLAEKAGDVVKTAADEAKTEAKKEGLA